MTVLNYFLAQMQTVENSSFVNVNNEASLEGQGGNLFYTSVLNFKAAFTREL